MVLSEQQLRLAEALAVERLHGAEAPAFIVSRIGTLALAGDVAGLERWKAIAAAFETLLSGSVQ